MSDRQASKQVNSITTSDKKLLRGLLWVAGSLVAMLILLQFTFIGGSVKFYAKWNECGQKPVRITSGYGGGYAWYETPPSFELFRFGDYEYYCTASEAHNAGYARTRDSF